MSIYELHEFDPDKIITGEINPDKIEPFKYSAFMRDSKGMSIIDKNTDLSNYRSLVNLNTTKTSQTKFNQVIDIEFAEFTRKDTGAPINFLQAKIDALDTERQKLLAAKQTDTQKIKALNDRIAQLLEQMKTMMQKPADTLLANSPNITDSSNVMYVTAETSPANSPNITDNVVYAATDMSSTNLPNLTDAVNINDINNLTATTATNYGMAKRVKPQSIK